MMLHGNSLMLHTSTSRSTDFPWDQKQIIFAASAGIIAIIGDGEGEQRKKYLATVTTL